ncbi:hypothetical protein, partial [Luedemannella helvata]|uniref:hypothetical protein n=1 Tax=Luedemannella helvata TaxID=349315 RepID=UPI0031DBB0F1
MGQERWAVERTALKRVVGALAAVLVLLAEVPATADPHDDKKRVDRAAARTRAALEIANGRAQAAGVAYTQVNRKLPGARRRLAVAQGQPAGARVAARTAARAARCA